MSRGGKRVGAGRRRGTSRQTIARNAIKAVANTLHLKPGKSRPALEVLQDLLDEALAIAAYFKPGPENKHADRAAHERFHALVRPGGLFLSVIDIGLPFAGQSSRCR
jgi:hypothetical protein